MFSKFYLRQKDATLRVVLPFTEKKAKRSKAKALPTLIVTNGSKINTVGTADEPFVFTSILAKTQTLSQNDKGLGWIILLGNAPINGEAPTEKQKPLPRLKDYQCIY